MACFPLFAVHISDGMLSGVCLLGGFVLAGLLLYWSCLRVHEEEIPRIAILTAAFFMASLIHVQVGFTSAHLLMNALVGIVLGRRAVVAIAVGLFLQALLMQHGGLTTLGVNCCVMALPALFASAAYRPLERLSAAPLVRSLLIGCAAFIWLLSLAYSLVLLTTYFPSIDDRAEWLEQANTIALNPWLVLAVALASVAVAGMETRRPATREFAAGLLIGEVTVLLTVALNAAVLIVAGPANIALGVLLLVVVHLPIAFVEGTILGFTTAFLARVKPQMLQGCHYIEPEHEGDEVVMKPGSFSPVEAEQVAP